MKDVKKTLALAIVVSAACFVFVAVLYRNHQRFTPATDTVRMALDTHTGMLCLKTGLRTLTVLRQAASFQVCRAPG
jgi:hypothetical protein